MSRLERRLPAALGLSAAVLYLSFPAAVYPFDAVACAIAVELGDFKHLVHGNHLIYGVLAWTWCTVLSALGVGGRAIHLMQAMDSLLGAAGVAVFCRALLRLKIGPLVAGAAAAGLAVSRLYWTLSLEAHVYPLGALFVFLAFMEACGEKPRPERVGFYHAVAILGHVGNAMFLPAAHRLLWTYREGDKKRFLRYFAALSGVVVVSYAAAAALWRRPDSFDELRVWLLGSAALDVHRKFTWVGGWSMYGFVEWTINALEMFGSRPTGACLWAVAILGGLAQLPGRRKLVMACVLWLAGYALLFTNWHPGQIYYRLTDLAPLWVLIALGAEHAAAEFPKWRRVPGLALAVGVAALGWANLNSAVIPNGNPDRNHDLQRVLWIARETPENAWVIVDDVDQVYLPYFAHRRPLNLRYFYDRPAALKQRVDELKARGEPVYVVPAALDPEDTQIFGDILHLETARRGTDALIKL